MSIADKLQTIANNQDAVFNAGKKSEYDLFWDNYQENGNRTSYINAFCAGWNDIIFKPKYDIKPTGNSTQMCANTDIVNFAKCIEDAGVIFDTSKATNLSYLFNNADTLTELPNIDLSSATSISYLFNGCYVLKKVSITFAENKATSYTSVFNNCRALENLTVSGVIDIPLSFSASSKLTNDSVQSIVEHLKDLTGQTAKKIDFHTDVLKNMTTAQAEAILAKNWTT